MRNKFYKKQYSDISMDWKNERYKKEPNETSRDEKYNI